MASSWLGQNKVMALQHKMQIGRHPICRGQRQVCLWPLSLQIVGFQTTNLNSSQFESPLIIPILPILIAGVEDGFIQ